MGYPTTVLALALRASRPVSGPSLGQKKPRYAKVFGGRDR